MKAPKLLQNESAKSFKKRVAAWEKKTGQKYPQSFTGQTDEERILSGAIQMGSAFESKKDYSKDYDLDQIAKEESLSPKYYQSYRDSKEGKKFSKEQEEIQSNVDQDLKEQAYARAASGEIDYGNVELPGEDEEDDTSVIPQTSLTDEEQANRDGKVQLIKKQNHETAVLKNEQYLKSIAGNGMNNTYTSDYREAIKADTGWKAFYDDSPDPNDPVRRSDVFTRAESDWGMYKEGDILGVMSRNERRAYDDAMHEAKMKSKHSLVQTPSPTWGVEGKEKSSKPNLVQTPSPTWGVGDGTPDPSVAAGSEGKTIFDPNKNRKKGGS